MVNYRRIILPGGTYFFTVCLNDRKQKLLIDYVSQLRAAFLKTRKRLPFEIISICVLPDHLHCILQLPENHCYYPSIWKSVKSNFSKFINKRSNGKYKNNNGVYNVWQKRYWEHLIRDKKDLNNHINYTHFNPVKHGLIDNVRDWPYSSFHQYVRLGKLESDWGSFTEDWDFKYFGDLKY